MPLVYHPLDERLVDTRLNIGPIVSIDKEGCVNTVFLQEVEYVRSVVIGPVIECQSNCARLCTARDDLPDRYATRVRCPIRIRCPTFQKRRSRTVTGFFDH